jgi:hypothetical protein
VVVVVLAITIPSAYQTYAASIQKQSLLGGQWVYQESDLSGATWISSNLPGNSTMTGDIRMQYILTDYFGVSVNTTSGYRYLENPGTTARPAYLVTYSLMAKNGYVQSLYGVKLPGNWTEALAQDAPVYYDNGNIVLW